MVNPALLATLNTVCMNAFNLYLAFDFFSSGLVLLLRCVKSLSDGERLFQTFIPRLLKNAAAVLFAHCVLYNL